MYPREQLEREIIGAILYDPNQFTKFRRVFQPDLFQNSAHKKVIQSMHLCHDEGLEIDLLNLRRVGKMSDEEMLALTDMPRERNNLNALSRLLTEAVISTKGVNLAALLQISTDPFEMMDRTNQFLNESTALVNLNSRRSKADLVNAFITYLERNARDGIQRIPTPYPTLTDMLKGGFDEGGYTILGGTPGSGKTSFMLGLAHYAAVNGVKTAFIEGEMTANEILERLNAISTGVDVSEIRKGNEFEKHSMGFLSELRAIPFLLVHCNTRTLKNLVDEVRQCVIEGCKLIFVDYLQCFAETGKRSAEGEYFLEIKNVSGVLRELALKNSVHIFVATSLNRRESAMERFTLNSFYGSSGLGHDCSTGMILSGEQQDLEELVSQRRRVRLCIVKNRNGARGDIELEFKLASQQFEEATLSQDDIPIHVLSEARMLPSTVQ